MNDKPASEHAEWCIGGVKGPCNCKPAGEWTEIVDRADKELEDTVSNFLAGLGYESGKVKEIILRAINAVLAAAVREAVLNDVGAEGSEYIMKLEQQLAAERERLSGPLLSNAERVAYVEEIRQLQGQVALMTVERNEAKNFHTLIEQKRRIIEELRGQLKQADAATAFWKNSSEELLRERKKSL